MRFKIVGDGDFADRRPERGQADAGPAQLFADRVNLRVGELRKAPAVHTAPLQQRDAELLQRFKLPVEIGRDFIGKRRKDEFCHTVSLSFSVQAFPSAGSETSGGTVSSTTTMRPDSK